MPHPFLSDAWLDEVKAIAAQSPAGVMPGDVRLNLVVTGGPEGDRQLHVADGAFGSGLKDDAPTKLTLPYAVARKMFVTGDQAAAMQAFMSGQIKVEGDMSKLMAAQASAGDPAAAAELQKKLQAVTADD